MFDYPTVITMCNNQYWLIYQICWVLSLSGYQKHLARQECWWHMAHFVSSSSKPFLIGWTKSQRIVTFCDTFCNIWILFISSVKEWQPYFVPKIPARFFLGTMYVPWKYTFTKNLSQQKRTRTLESCPIIEFDGSYLRCEEISLRLDFLHLTLIIFS